MTATVRPAGPLWWDLLVHLRINFQLILAPIFLWGFLLAGGLLGWRLVVGFLAVHMALYGGITALNSYYDRDEGPVGGLWSPPPWRKELLPFAWAVQLLGLLAIVPLGLGMVVTYVAMMVLSVAYSHPAIRLKRRPLGALAVIAVGQGVLGFLTGWFSATPSPAGLLSLDIVIAIVGITLATVGLYPLTHIYQVREDSERGDVTFAVRWGPDKAFRFALTAFGLALVCIGWVLLRRFGWPTALIVAAFYALVLADIERWRRRFDPAAVRANYRHVMRLSYIVAAAFSTYVLGMLIRQP